MDKLFKCDDVIELFDNEKTTGKTFVVLGCIGEDAMVRIDGHVLTFSLYSGECREHPELSIKQLRSPDMALIEGFIKNMHANARNESLSDKDYRDVVTSMLDKLVTEFD